MVMMDRDGSCITRTWALNRAAAYLCVQKWSKNLVLKHIYLRFYKNLRCFVFRFIIVTAFNISYTTGGGGLSPS